VLTEDTLVPPSLVDTGDDVVRGGPGGDIINSQDGKDSMYGGAGNDTMSTLSPTAKLYGGGDHDYLLAGNGFASGQQVVLHGGAANDRLEGLDLGSGSIVDGDAGKDSFYMRYNGTGALELDLSGHVHQGSTTFAVRDVESWRVWSGEGTPSVDVQGTGGRDHLTLFTNNGDATVTGAFGAGADLFSVHRQNASVAVNMGAGDDRFHKGSPGGITASLGKGDDLVETTRSTGPIGDPAPSRTYDGGPGTDTAHLDLTIPNNSCTSIEKGNCP
jgi:Ca2+-binding RTX toxin-like protein